jgi:aspartate carbamoyltransferase catalytic subunit
MHSSALGQGLDGLRVAIVGDIAHSRVARSNLHLLKTLGAKVFLVGPATLLPSALVAMADGYSYSLDAAIEEFDLDAVMMLRVQLERMSASFFPSEREYARIWGLNGDRLDRLKSGSFILHPGPMNRGLEIDARSADSGNSLVLAQVANGVSVRMATLYKLLAGGSTNE